MVLKAHGTGTEVGDPIEVEAISNVFHHKTGRHTIIGGIKPSLGHSEGASGISSIIKVVLALEKSVIPATIGVSKINPSIKTDEWNIEIATTHHQWPKSLLPRASVNSFGFGGANGHAILEAANTHIPSRNGHAMLLNDQSTSAQELPCERLFLLTFSARTEHSLMQVVENLAVYASQQKEPIDMRDLAYTLNCRRSRLATRRYLVAKQSSLRNDLRPSRISMGSTGLSMTLPTVFVYTGQGAQWPGMGSQLINQYSVFRNSIKYLDSCLQELSSDLSPAWSLEAALLAPPEASDIHLAEKSQPICTAVQIALTDLLHEWGIIPETVIGHSSGEIGAAYAAGHLTARQAIVAAFCRGLAVSRSQSVGAMMAVGLDRSQAQEIINELTLQNSAGIACTNSPESSTLSGDAAAIEKLYTVLQERKIFAKKLKTDGKAYHSRHMKAVGLSYQTMLELVWHCSNGSVNGLSNGTIDDRKFSSVRMISTVTGFNAIPEKVSSPGYWRTNLESPVRFDDAIRGLLEGEQCHFIEIGPHSSLELPITQTATRLGKSRDYYSYSPALVRNKDAVVTVLGLVGSLFLHGHDNISFDKMILYDPDFTVQEPKHLADLPTYPWDYTAPTLWKEPRSVAEFRNRIYPRHDLIGSQIPGGIKSTTTWRNILSINEVTWLRDHCLGPSIVFPAAAYFTMAVEAMCQVSELQLHECPGVDLRNFNFLKALDFHPDQRPQIEIFTEMRQVQISSMTSSKRWWHFSVVSCTGDNAHPVTHANGLVSLSVNSLAIVPRQIRLKKDNMEQQANRVWYAKFKEEGLNWGPQFAVMEDIFCDRARQAHQASATTHLLRGDNNGARGGLQYIAHPISIDSMLQTAFVATTGGWVKDLRATVPVTVDFVHFSAPAMLDMDTNKQWFIDTVSEKVGFGTFKIDAELYNSSNQVLIRMEKVRCIAYQGNVQREAAEQRNPLVRVAWKPDITAIAAGANGSLSRYLDWFAETFRTRGICLDGGLKRLAGLLDLAVHKRPSMRILELGGGPETKNLFMNVMHAESQLRRFSSYFRGFFSFKGELLGSEIPLGIADDEGSSGVTESISKGQEFDLVIISTVGDTQNAKAFKNRRQC